MEKTMTERSETPKMQASSAAAGAREASPNVVTGKGKPRKLKFFMDGAWHESKSGNYMPVTNSSTGELMAEAPRCSLEEVNAAVESAAEAFPGWRDTAITQRVQMMFRYKAILEEHVGELATLLSTEMGKTLVEARGDVLKAIEVVELACALPVSMQGRSLMDVSTGYDTVSYREPLGVFVGIAPFNFPAMIPLGWMVPLAITTGNTYVLKAASLVPQTAMRMVELLVEAGMPKGVLNLVTASRHEAEPLLRHPMVKGVTLVGSKKIGLHVYQTAAAEGKRVQSLTEAKNHALVLKDAPIMATAQRIINSAFGCAGERCMALPAICVEEEVADELVSAITDLAKQLKMGPAWQPDTQLGPLVTDDHRQGVHGWVQKGVDEGADLILDGRPASVQGYEGGYFMGPTVFDNVTPEMRVGIDEIFGPVLSIKRVKDFEEGLEEMHSSEFANGSSIFTLSGPYAREFSRRTHGGMVGINVGIPVPMSVFPFCGHKNSFYGDLHVMGVDGMMFYTETKAVTTHWFDEEGLKGGKVGTWEGTMTRD
jgi:malonate-semialdehyde dehydrogenase (acetylating)/methylmalonate-semialdehyde dehydrogenase